MKRFSILLIILIAFVLGCVVGPNFRSTPAEAQALTTKSDLITLFRSDATSLLSVRGKIRAHKASYDALAFSWADEDFVGANAGITATQFTTAVSNLADICDKFDAGGSLAVGLPTTVNRIANVNIAEAGTSDGQVFATEAGIDK